MKKLITIIILCILFIGCSTTKTLKFNQKENETVKTESLKNFLNTNKNPKVVLRVNNSTVDVTENSDNDYLFNAIENQLLASGFIVRDRQLFNQIIENQENNIDYNQIKEKSDTDLIIELTRLEPNILYETNKYYDKNNEEKVDNMVTYERYGASVEFKVIMINSNEFAGLYKFNYTPCVDGCVISKSPKEIRRERKMKQKEDEKEKAYEGVEKDKLELFMKDATKRLVMEMRE